MSHSRSERSRPSSGVQRVKEQFLTALHVGRLQPGDRVPSIRRLADLTGLNRKTIHRAYSRLAKDGLLQIRKGSGTFLAEKRDGINRSLAASELLSAINRCRSEAATLGLHPAVFARFVHLYLGDGLRGLPTAVVECNHEQVGLIVGELRRTMGLSPRAVLLADLGLDPRRVLNGSRTVITTDCHREEVEELVQTLGYTVYRVALAGSYARTLIEHARRGPLVMVVKDARYAPVLRRLLAGQGATSEMLERVQVVEPPGAVAALAEVARRPSAVYVSPNVESEVAPRIPAGPVRVEMRRHLDAASFDRMRSRIALDIALDEKRH